MNFGHIRAVIQRHVIADRRDPSQIFLLAVLPIVDTFLFSTMAVDGSDPDRLAAVVAGLMMFHIVWQVTIAATMGLLAEVWSRNMLNIAATPLRDREMFAAFGVVGLARAVISSTLIAAVSSAFYGVDPVAAGSVLVPGALIAVGFGAAVSIAVLGLILEYGDRAEVFSWGTLVLILPLSGAFYPVDSLPAALRPLARLVPLTMVFDALRDGLAGGGVAWARLSVAAAATVLVGLVVSVFYVVQRRRFRRNGWITRFS